MLSISGFYDGKNIKPLEETPKNKKFKVVITFIEELEDATQLRDFSSQTNSFAFWEDPKEDIYQDFLGKSKK
ncbi:MAG: hypothetical protein ABIT08_01735 [Bacteroidia bacterium]